MAAVLSDATLTDFSVNHCKPRSEMIMRRRWRSALGHMTDEDSPSQKPRNVDQLATVWSFRSFIGKWGKEGREREREDGAVVPRLQLQPRLTGFRLLRGWSRSGALFLHQWPIGRRETARWRWLNVVGTHETRTRSSHIDGAERENPAEPGQRSRSPLI